MFQQKNYPLVVLDTVENIISLCPNCHREVHFSDNKREILNTLYTKNESFMLANNFTMKDLYKMYKCNTKTQ